MATKPNTLQWTPCPTHYGGYQAQHITEDTNPHTMETKPNTLCARLCQTYLPTQKSDVICGCPLGLVPIIVLGLSSFLHNVLGLVAIVLGLVSSVMCWA